MTNGEEELAVEELNVRAVVGLVASVAVALVGLFALPALRSFGLSFWVAFWSLLAVEFLAFLGVAVSVLRLHEERSFE
ncbi:hypothetical protein [Natronomonas marina]|jgi:hypothetical protein|uniref:hypothetical protein n=1 Tax=Natronomonas marina TaxID=2961939 RepID=UPI0020C95F0F|nr:hypothetical protein [Natronomonas marina]